MTATDVPEMPQRCIRAHYDDDTITVYQAYNAEIAEAAVAGQRLDASPSYMPKRMTWIKPSWTWMMYRSGYASKDQHQTHILAIKMRHGNFVKLLEHVVLAANDHAKGQTVVVQWDPERGPRLEKLEYRSIQIGIPGQIRETWIAEWIDSIEDVSARAREMKIVLDGDGAIGREELVARGSMPGERVYDVPEHVKLKLGMDSQARESVAHQMKQK